MGDSNIRKSASTSPTSQPNTRTNLKQPQSLNNPKLHLQTNDHLHTNAKNKCHENVTKCKNPRSMPVLPRCQKTNPKETSQSTKQCSTASQHHALHPERTVLSTWPSMQTHQNADTKGNPPPAAPNSSFGIVTTSLQHPGHANLTETRDQEVSGTRECERPKRRDGTNLGSLSAGEGAQ